MKEVIQQAQKRKGLTQEEAAGLLHMDVRHYRRIVNGEVKLTADLAYQISKVLNCPQINDVFCTQSCIIGRHYNFTILNNVDLNANAILAKYLQEEGEAHDALMKMMVLVLNKRGKEDCSDSELHEIWKSALELLDLQHVIEVFVKQRLWDFLDVEQLIQAHNDKCLEKRYVDPNQPELKIVNE